MTDQKRTGQAGARIQTATLGGGCFWCLEPVYEELKGVVDVEVGYAGGKLPNPSYEQVCSGMTGHAEVVRITFDAGQISYESLLKVFFSIHDPTTLNRQGADIGKQYRSIILYHNPEQEATARRLIQQITQEKLWPNPVVTEVVPLQAYYKAEDYHQEYFRKNPSQGYCSVVIAPKVAKFRKKYAEHLKKS